MLKTLHKISCDSPFNHNKIRIAQSLNKEILTASRGEPLALVLLGGCGGRGLAQQPAECFIIEAESGKLLLQYHKSL